MPYKILKRGKEYILKSHTQEYKHKTIAKAKAQKRLLEEREAKVVQRVSQKQQVKTNIVVNVAPSTKRRNYGATRAVARPDKAPVPERIQMLPAALPSAQQIAYELQVLNRSQHLPRTDILERRTIPTQPEIVPQPRPVAVPVIDPNKHSYDREVPDYFLRPDIFDPVMKELDSISARQEPISDSRRAEFSRMTVTELRALLRDRDVRIPAGARKSDLVELAFNTDV